MRAYIDKINVVLITNQDKQCNMRNAKTIKL